MELSSPKSGVSFYTFLQLFALMSGIMFSAGCMAPDAHFPTARIRSGIHSDAVNINTATATQLAALEGFGPITALRIIEHRKEFGRFRKPADIMLVEGIGENRFLKIRNMIRTE